MRNTFIVTPRSYAMQSKLLKSHRKIVRKLRALGGTMYLSGGRVGGKTVFASQNAYSIDHALGHSSMLLNHLLLDTGSLIV